RQSPGAGRTLFLRADRSDRQRLDFRRLHAEDRLPRRRVAHGNLRRGAAHSHLTGQIAPHRTFRKLATAATEPQRKRRRKGGAAMRLILSISLSLHLSFSPSLFLPRSVALWLCGEEAIAKPGPSRRLTCRSGSRRPSPCDGA